MSIHRSLILTAIVCALGGAASANGTISGNVSAKPGKFLKDSIVYVTSAPTKSAPENAKIDQTGMAFSPHIVLVAVGDTVTFQNHDKVDHNVMSLDGGYNLGTFGTGQSRKHKFDKPGVFAQICKLHPEMLAYVFVGQNRFAAVVDASGKFTIGDVPAGNYELAIWNPKLKASTQKITVTNDQTTSVQFALKR
jgi:plastocyanin